MFMQIRVPKVDQRALRFIWKTKEGEIQLYKYTRHIFGAKSSPSVANFVVRKCIDDFATSEIVEQAKRSFYMDDYVKSTDSVEEARELTTKVTKALRQGGLS